MENHENRKLLEEAIKQALAELKDSEPGTNEYAEKANVALKLYDMWLKEKAQEDEDRRKTHETEVHQLESKHMRKIEIGKMAVNAGVGLLTAVGTVYWSICEAGGVIPLSAAMKDGMREIKRFMTK